MRARQPVKAQMRNFDLRLGRITKLNPSQPKWIETSQKFDKSMMIHCRWKMWYRPPNGHSNEQNSPRREELKATADRRKQTQELQQFPLSLRGCTKIAVLVGKMWENDDHPNRILTFKF
jgi:hypothetical protein